MKKLPLAVFTLFFGAMVFAQSDPILADTKTRTIRFFVNDQPFVGSISGLDPKDIARIEVDKTADNTVRIYTNKGARRGFMAVERYLRKQFKGYGKNERATVSVDGVAMDVPAQAILLPKSVRSVSRTFTPEGDATYRVETIDDGDKSRQKGGIRIRGTAFHSPAMGQATPEIR